MTVVLRFDLPFSLNVDGSYELRTLGESFSVDLVTHRVTKPQFPGAERVEGLAILNDDSNILSYTKVTAQYTPQSSSPIVHGVLSRQIPEITIAITNALVSALRISFGEYHIDYLYSADKLGPIYIDVPAFNGGKRFSCCYDGLQGGITFQRAPRSGAQAAKFAQTLLAGASLSPAEEILFNGRRYLLRGDLRMALANLAISFEVGLSDRLARVANARGDAILEAEIASAALNDLGTKFAKKTLGTSFARRNVWGDRFHDVFEWLRVARNGVLHKAQLLLSYGGRTRNFADKSELQSLYDDHDWFMGELDNAIARALAENPASPGVS